MKTKNIRLLYFLKSLEIGGMEKSTILYSNILCEKLGFVGIYADKGFYDNSNLVDVKVERYYPRHSIWKKIFFLSNLKDIIRIVRTEKITHIHYHHRIFIPFVFLLKIFFPQNKIIYSHQNVFNDFLNYFIFADKIIALTEAAKNDLRKSLKNRTSVIPHGTILPKQVMQNKKPTKFGYVGRFVDWKEVILLIQQFGELNKKLKWTKLFLVGDGPLKKEMKNEVDILNLKEDVKFITPQNDLSKIYHMIDVLVLPSKSLEGFGIVLIEAMSYGIPVIVFDLPIYNDTVIDNYNGIVVNNSISAAMLKIVESENFYYTLSENAKLHSSNFEINNIIHRYLTEIYSD